MKPKIGDWIRFMHGGHLVIDEVAYILPRGSFDSTPEAMTISHGQIGFTSIVELRPRTEILR